MNTQLGARSFNCSLQREQLDIEAVMIGAYKGRKHFNQTYKQYFFVQSILSTNLSN
jgi:hypothetical protein